MLSPFQCISLDYTECLQQWYEKLRDLPGFVLLESTDKVRGRYDILSAYPYDRITLTTDSDNILGELDKITHLLKVVKSDIDLPFQGGAIGFVAYDLGVYLAGLELSSQPNFEALPLLDLGFYDWALITDHHVKTVTLFAAHKEPSTEGIVSEVLDLWHKAPHDLPQFSLKTPFEPLITKQRYEEAFNAIHNALKTGRSYQVNLTQPFEAYYEGDVWSMYKRISAQNRVPFSAFMRTKEADIVSFSPERFLCFEEGALLTSPIKGTIGRSTDYQEDERLKDKLARCPKNQAENVMIVDLLRNDLGKIAKTGSVEVANLCTVQSFHSVHHLVSDIKAQCLDDVHPFAAFMACFPGGSITGAPKLEAMHIINEQEPFGRGVYCGSLGYFSFHGRFDTNIAIRTVTASQGSLHLAAGGGIVIDSLCEDEYKESITKIRAITQVLEVSPP